MPRRFVVFAVFLSAYFLSYFFRSTNAVIADDLVRDVGLGSAQLGLMTSLFFFVFAAAQLPLGSALDRFGSRWVTPALMLAAVAGSLLFAAASGFPGLAAGRGLIGLGMAGVLMGSLKAFAGWFRPRVFATVSSVFVGLGSLGALAAATPLARLSGAFGWRAVFVGAAAVTLASAALIVGFGRNAPGAVEAGGGRSGAFGEIFRRGAFWRVAFMTLAVTGALFAWQTLWAGPYLFDALQLGATEVGDLLLAMGIGATVGYFVVGPLADRLGVPQIAAVWGGMLVLVQLALAVFPENGARWSLATLFVAFGFFGTSSILYFAHVRALFPATPGRAVTAANLFGIGGSAALQGVLGLLIGAFPLTALGDAPAVAYRSAFAATATLGALALAAYLPLLRRPFDESA